MPESTHNSTESLTSNEDWSYRSPDSDEFKVLISRVLDIPIPGTPQFDKYIDTDSIWHADSDAKLTEAMDIWERADEKLFSEDVLEGLLSRLTERQRQTIELFFALSPDSTYPSTKEVAEQMSISTSAANQNFNRSIAKMRKKAQNLLFPREVRVPQPIDLNKLDETPLEHLFEIGLDTESDWDNIHAARNILRRAKITNVRQLTQLTEEELLDLGGMGKARMGVIKKSLGTYGIKLAE